VQNKPQYTHFCWARSNLYPVLLQFPAKHFKLVHYEQTAPVNVPTLILNCEEQETQAGPTLITLPSVGQVKSKQAVASQRVQVPPPTIVYLAEQSAHNPSLLKKPLGHFDAKHFYKLQTMHWAKGIEGYVNKAAHDLQEFEVKFGI